MPWRSVSDLTRVIYCGVWHPIPGAVMTNDYSGGLRGLRPPATFWQPFGLRAGKPKLRNQQNCGSGLRFFDF